MSTTWICLDRDAFLKIIAEQAELEARDVPTLVRHANMMVFDPHERVDEATTELLVPEEFLPDARLILATLEPSDRKPHEP